MAHTVYSRVAAQMRSCDAGRGWFRTVCTSCHVWVGTKVTVLVFVVVRHCPWAGGQAAAVLFECLPHCTAADWCCCSEAEHDQACPGPQVQEHCIVQHGRCCMHSSNHGMLMVDWWFGCCCPIKEALVSTRCSETHTFTAGDSVCITYRCPPNPLGEGVGGEETGVAMRH